MGIYVLLFMGTTPIGSLICGLLAEHVGGGGSTGVRATLLITAGLCAVGVVSGLVYAHRSAAKEGVDAGGEQTLVPQAVNEATGPAPDLEKGRVVA